MFEKITEESEQDQYVKIGDVQLNASLHMTPADPLAAEGYDKLYQLWKSAYNGSREGRFWEVNDPEFKDWDAQVLSLLTPQERARYDQPLKPNLAHIPDCASGAPTSRSNHLTKILWARQGFEKFMKNKD